MLFAGEIGDPGIFHQIIQARAGEARGHLHRWHIAASGERILRGNGADKAAIKIFRAVGPEGDGRIF